MPGIFTFPPRSYRSNPQKGSTTIAANATSNTTAITAVGPRAYILHHGNVFALGGGSPGEDLSTFSHDSVELTSNVLVTARRGHQADANTSVSYWTVIDPL